MVMNYAFYPSIQEAVRLIVLNLKPSETIKRVPRHSRLLKNPVSKNEKTNQIEAKQNKQTKSPKYPLCYEIAELKGLQ